MFEVAYDTVVQRFGERIDLVYTALIAVQVAAGQAPGADAKALCGSVDGDGLNAAFVGVELGVGTEVRNFVCGKGAV